ncbi:MAG TPA: hypothetical protein VM582_02870 [Candidatus Thermoplasmatota archaeon]|nr:hypothetical protein [Candidatus Thermoplasmatota archaeon]
MRPLLALAAVLLAAGCLGANEGPAAPTPARELALEAPWWNIGESWTIRFTQGGSGTRTTTLVNFANNTFGDPPHFWLGTADRQEALDHVFYDNNPFLGRIHWVLLAPHEKGMHSTMYEWPLKDGATWTSPILFGHNDILVSASARPDGSFAIKGQARADGAPLEYDYDPAVRWFRQLKIDEGRKLSAEVTDHKESGARGTYYFLRGRDYLDAAGGSTGDERPFTVRDEGATSIAFRLDVRTSGPAALEFVDPSGAAVHREALPLGGAANKVVEVKQPPAPGEWKMRYVGTVQGSVLVRGIIEYKATI